MSFETNDIDLHQSAQKVSTDKRNRIDHGWAVASQAEEKNCPEGC